MITTIVVLAVATAAGLLLGDRKIHLEKAPLERIGLFLVAGALAVAPLLLPRAAWASPVGRVLTIASYGVLFIAFASNFSRAGIALVAVGAAMNLVVIVGNGGRMPVEVGAALQVRPDALHRLSQPGHHRHTVATSATRLRPLDDRFPVTPLKEVVSVGDLVMAAGLAWWALAVTGARSSRRFPEQKDVAASPSPGGW